MLDGEAVRSGDRRRALEALRDFLTGVLEGGVEDKSVASISKQLADVVDRLDAMPVPEELSAVDELSKRRTARRASVQ